jgi:hypothetical protein
MAQKLVCFRRPTVARLVDAATSVSNTRDRITLQKVANG